MEALAITFGDSNCASSYYRIYQYREYLQKYGINLKIIPAVEFTQWDDLGNSDVVIIQKKLFATGKVKRLRKLAKKLIYDIDDAIWEPHGKEHHWFTRWRTSRRLKCVAQLADCCVCANKFLANYIGKYSKRCEIVPMALDNEKWGLPYTKKSNKIVLTIGWIGSPSNLPFFTSIESALYIVQRKFKNVEFVVYSGERPRLRQLFIKHIPYSSEGEVSVVSNFDIGLLPLDTTPFAQGKSPIKALKYMACGIPTIATPTCGVKEILTENETALFAQSEEEWLNRLEKLITNSELRAHIGANARREFEDKFTIKKTGKKIVELLSEL
ncbi:MAG: glycosyltransferase family 4 protein [Verrucomicrobiia bacterium]